MEVMDGMPKSRIGVTNVMLALAISLLINFSYLLILFESKTSDDSNIPSEQSHHKKERVVEIDRTGVLNIMPDGYGYIVYPAGSEIDSVYVHSGRIWRYGLHNGDRMVVSAEEPRKAGAHHSLEKVYSVNGKPFEYESRFDKPNSASQTAIQIISYWVLTFLLLTILTLRMRKRSWQYYASRYTACLLLVALFYFVAPTLGIRGDLPRGMIDIMLILKCSFVLVVAVLYGRIYGLLYQRQWMVLEYEQLKNENLSTRYRVLMSQISPHFLFNSLNSLSMLVRDELVSVFPRKGYMVTEVSLTDMRDMHQYRYILENANLVYAVKHATKEQLARLDELAEQDRYYTEDEPHFSKEVISNNAFHFYLAEMTGNRILVKQLTDTLEKLQRIMYFVAEKNYMFRGCEEHHELVRLIAAKELEKAQLVLHHHISEVLEHISQVRGISKLF